MLSNFLHNSFFVLEAPFKLNCLWNLIIETVEGVLLVFGILPPKSLPTYGHDPVVDPWALQGSRGLPLITV